VVWAEVECLEDGLQLNQNINLRHKLPKQSAKAVVDEDKCAGCGICVDVCPQGVITMDRVAKIDVNKCIGCGICVNECPRSAISLKG
jgi:2-oxoacid:acceptor oxidoreductase delta subunit (pyruvate/2-ketoisovalerate family)